MINEKIEDIVFERNELKTEVKKLKARIKNLRLYLSYLAEGDCFYGDNCPTFGSRHGQCVWCEAREALEKDNELIKKG